MTLNVECGFCGGGFEVDDIHAGRRVRCPTCKRIVRVPPREEFRARAEQPQAAGDPGSKTVDSAAPRAYELGEGRPAKAEPSSAPAPKTARESAPEKTNGVIMRRVARVLVAIVVISTALAIWDNFGAIWQSVSPVTASGIRDIVAAFRNWAREFIPNLTHLRPGIGKPFGVTDQVIVAAILMVLALRIMLRSALLEAFYGDAPDEKASKRRVAGLLFHFLALMLLVAVVAAAGMAVSEGRTVVGAWLIASFMVLSSLSLAVMRLVSRAGGVGAMARVFNDGIFGAAAIVLLGSGGIPQAPFGLIEQCAVLALANSVVGLAISGSLFENGASRNVAKGLGFSALGVIILLVTVILFSTTGQVR